MAKLSIAGPSFEGNAARKMPPREIEKDEDEEDEITEVIERPAVADIEPVTQRMPKRTAKAAEEAAREDQEQTSRIQERLRTSMEKSRTRNAPKTAKALEEKGEQADAEFMARRNEERKAEGLSKEFAEALSRRRGASIEEARQLLPHGDRVFEMISSRLSENMASGIQLAIEVERDELFSGQKYDLATEYVRILAKYRKAAESGDDQVRQETLEKLTRINRTLGIPLNAEVESNLEKEDLGYAREQMKTSQAEYAAQELKQLSKESSGNMNVERVKKYNLLKRPADLWDNLAGMLPKGQENLATEYVLTLARVNEAARGVNAKAYDEAKETLDQMSAALGIQNRADILSETLPRPGEKYENPFGA